MNHEYGDHSIYISDVLWFIAMDENHCDDIYGYG